MTERIYINNDWEFTENYSEKLLQPQTDYPGLVKVRLPHTCKETQLHYFDESVYQMVSGYRKVIMASESWEGKKILLTIEGAAHICEVYVNGSKVGEHHCGYTAFTVDLSGQLHYGEENILVIKVDSRETNNIPPFGYVIDYMTYGGIYRDVYLEVKNESYLTDVFVRSDLTQADLDDSSKMTVQTSSGNVISEISCSTAGSGLYVRQSFRKKGTVSYQMLGESKVAEKQISLRFPVEKAELWNLESPVLYEMKTELLLDGTVLDEKIVTFGFRRAEFLQDGFYLNGKKVRIRGLNRHQSYPYVGYAMPESMQKLDADILKNELGVNAVRTSHYPQSHYFLNRCDEIGLLVFTEIPGWQHIGDEAWKDAAVRNVRDMVLQYRNHTSIILWGVRINESKDDEAFYRTTNEMAHSLDPSRATGGVRAHKKSQLFEDVYTYNDFVHSGNNRGCDHKKDVTSDKEKPYLISEYNGHMYPTKSFDWEEHRVEHAMRHANVLDAVAGETDIAGSFGWCMFDYNTHKDFGSGDRICYHGVMDMFRNPKPAAVIYACQQEKEPVLELSSSMDIGEHPGCNRGTTYIFTNATSVRMYKNDRFIKEYQATDSPYKNLKHGPIIVDDFIGDAIETEEEFKPGQAKAIKNALNAAARYGLSNLPKSVYLTAVKMMVVYHMKPVQAVELYNRYIGDWGGTSTTYRFEAVEQGKVVKTIVKEPMRSLHLSVTTDHINLEEKHTYDVAAVRLQALDQNDNLMSFYNDPVVLETEGPIEIMGPAVLSLQGGMGGTYVKTCGRMGDATLRIKALGMEACSIAFQITVNG